jgi:diguanylate cyclase (GGDEF)-like protein/PAS domain S-box-containing protein
MRLYSKLFDFDELKKHFNERKMVKDEVLEGLFVYLSRTLAALFIVEAILLYMLLPYIGNILYLWFLLIASVTISRLYDAYLFHRDPQRYTPFAWHKKFVIKAWLTAFLLSLMVIFVVPQLDPYYQLFVFTVLLGVTGGALNALSSDPRTALGYIMILLLPLSVEMMFLREITSFIIGLLLILYFFTLVSVILQASVQQEIMEKKNREILQVESKLYEKEEMLELFFDQAPIGIFMYNTSYIITDCNRAFLQLFGIERDKLLGLDLHQLPDQSPLESMKNALLHRRSQVYIGPYNSTRGYTFWVEAKISPIFDRKHHVVGGLVLLENKTKEHNALKELEYSALHDALTTLSNRRGFKRFMEHMMTEEEHHSHYSVLFYLDLNQFKQINDSLGHSMGDKVLVAIGRRLVNMMQDAKNITRLGGDEFIAVIPFLDTDLERAKEKIETYIEIIKKIFDDPFMIEGVRLHLKSSIGIVIIEPKFNNIEEIVRHADISMYQAKKHGLDFISYYNTKLDEERKKIFNLQHQLVTSLRDNELKIYFQPIVYIEDDSIYAAEALIRWEHPTNGLMGAESFIPIAVESGIVVDIGWWVIERVCQQIVKWKDEEVWKLQYISININAKQLLKNRFAEDFIHMLEKYGIQSSDIKIEITETSLIDNFKLTQEVILSLQEYGIGCAIDDFGIGYSSLSYLKKLSFSDLKIDREFMHALDETLENIELIHTMINIGKQFNYNVIIEGIEEPFQKNIIKEIDPTIYYQGYLMSPPIPEEEFKKRFLCSS